MLNIRILLNVFFDNEEKGDVNEADTESNVSIECEQGWQLFLVVVANRKNKHLEHNCNDMSVLEFCSLSIFILVAPHAVDYNPNQLGHNLENLLERDDADRASSMQLCMHFKNVLIVFINLLSFRAQKLCDNNCF